MAKIVIDTDKWMTQVEKAKSWQGKQGKGVSVEYICKLIHKGKLKGWKIPELGIHLVER